MYKRILVPLDGSETARFGLREAISLAKEHKSSLRLLHVVSPFHLMMEISAGEDIERYHQALVEAGELLLRDAKALCASLDVQTEISLRKLQGGRVADAIVDEAREAGCDLIAIGTHGRRGVSRALLGSDAERVLRQATVPVLLIRERPAKS